MSQTQPTSFEQAIRDQAEEICKLVISKQRDYGTKNILNSPFGAEHGIIVRLHDKLARVANLTTSGDEPANESIEDSWMDVAGYAFIALMVRKGNFELPLEK